MRAKMPQFSEPLGLGSGIEIWEVGSNLIKR